MLNHIEAKMFACWKIAELFGIDYFKTHIEEACQGCPPEDDKDINYEYFLGFEGDKETNKWLVFARVSVNRETQETVFLDYKTPDGKRMENPIKPVRSA